MPPGTLCAAMAVSIVWSISCKRSGSKRAIGCVVRQPARSAAAIAMLSRRMFPLRNQRSDCERRQRSDDGVPRPGDMGCGENDGDGGNACTHAAERADAAGPTRRAEKENAEDWTVDQRRSADRGVDPLARLTLQRQ